MLSSGLLDHFSNCLHGLVQSVILNSQRSNCERILSGVPRGSFLRPLLFLISINDLPDQINSICKTFWDNTSLSSPVQVSSSKELNNDLQIYLIGLSSFKPDTNKQTQEVYFSRKTQRDDSENLIFNRCKFDSSSSRWETKLWWPHSI